MELSVVRVYMKLQAVPTDNVANRCGVYLIFFRAHRGPLWCTEISGNRFRLRVVDYYTLGAFVMVTLEPLEGIPSQTHAQLYQTPLTSQGVLI